MNICNAKPITFRAYSQSANIANKSDSDAKLSQSEKVDFSMKVKENLSNRTLSGSIDGSNYNIIFEPKLLKPYKITGNIADRKLDLDYDINVKRNTLKGNIGNMPVDIKFVKSNNRYDYKINGQINNEQIDLILKYENNTYKVIGENTDITAINNLLHGGDLTVDINKKGDTNLNVLLISLIYDLCKTEVNVKINNDAAAAYATGMIVGGLL